MIKTFKLCSIAIIILTLFFSIKYANGSNGNIYQDQFSFLNLFSGIPQLAQVLPTQDNKIKMRDFSIDTQGKSLFNSSVDIENDGKLIEYANGKKIKDWKIKYEKKGSSRGMCEPPVINLSFDKYDSKGKAKELFTGLSTYKDNKTLQYQKIRLIPECDIWTDYFNGGRIGFRGQLNVNLREFIVHKIFREFKIPTADVLGFANINIISSDSGYNGKTFRYMIIQRPQELDDQIPFTTQFNFKPDIYASGSGSEWIEKYGDRPSPLVKKIVSTKTNEERVINFDVESKMRFDILTSFLNLSDMGFLHNEDGGIDVNTGLAKSIPHGFDASFDCYVDDNRLIFDGFYPTYVSDQKYKDIFYSVSREIFLDSKNLDKMISFVDSFPYNNVDKELLKNFLKIRFYQLSSYVNSSEFANSLNKDYLPKIIELPFKNEQEYSNALTDFRSRCNLPKIDLKGVTVSDIKDFSISSTTNDQYYDISFNIDIKTGDKALQLFRKNNIFVFNMLDAKDGKKIREIYMPIRSLKGINQNVIGPYYEIPPNTTVNLAMGYILDKNYILKDEYVFTLDSFTPNNNFNPFKLNYKTKVFSLGKVEPIVVKTPRLGEVIDASASSTYTITWSGEKDKYVAIYLNDEHGNAYFITNPSDAKKLNNKFVWDLGKVYKSQFNNFVLSDLPDGKYSIVVYYTELDLVPKEISFNYISSNKSKKPTISILSVKAKLNYNIDSSESFITVNSEIDINVPTSTTMIVPKRYAFGVYGRNEKGNYLDGNTVYTSNEAKPSGENYELSGGKNYRFSLITRTSDVINAFPGVYTFGVGGMSYGYNYENNLQFPIKSPNISNKLAVIGEKAPYINSIDSPVYFDKPVIIRGVRFGKEPVRILVGKDERVEAVPTNSYIEDTVSFIPKYLGFEKGFIPIQIVNKFGASNYYYIELK